ncbi:hypothetical protein KAI58_01385 [Candidatus Gracilibacteria bacterium]|nr:hypothetical protein [Candidatus Gracilibacteria bacterium]
MEFESFLDSRCWNSDCDIDDAGAFERCQRELEQTDEGLVHNGQNIKGPAVHMDFRGNIFKECLFTGHFVDCNFAGALLRRCDVSRAIFNLVTPEKVALTEDAKKIVVLDESTLVPFCDMVEVSMYEPDKPVTFMPVEISLDNDVSVSFLMRMYDWEEPKTRKIKQKVGLIALKDMTFVFDEHEHRLFRGGIYYMPRFRNKPPPQSREDLVKACKERQLDTVSDEEAVNVVSSSQLHPSHDVTLRFARMLDLKDLETQQIHPDIQKYLFPLINQTNKNKERVRSII